MVTAFLPDFCRYYWGNFEFVSTILNFENVFHELHNILILNVDDMGKIQA